MIFIPSFALMQHDDVPLNVVACILKGPVQQNANVRPERPVINHQFIGKRQDQSSFECYALLSEIVYSQQDGPLCLTEPISTRR